MPAELELFYSPYCLHCRKAREQLRVLAGAWSKAGLRLREHDVLEEVDRAVAIGVRKTPALAIDGKLIAGSIPSRRVLERLLRQYISDGGAR